MKYLYLGAVRQTDSHLETLVSSLPTELLDETIIIVFGDHGEAFTEGEQLGHNEVIPEVCHVPLLIRDPTGTLPQTSVSNPVQLIDLYPTLGTLTSTDVPETRASDLTDGATPDPVYTHAGSPDADEQLMSEYGAWRSLSDYLIWSRNSGTESRSGDADGLRDSLETHLNQLSFVSPGGSRNLDPEAKGRLRELGYL